MTMQAIPQIPGLTADEVTAMQAAGAGLVAGISTGTSSKNQKREED